MNQNSNNHLKDHVVRLTPKQGADRLAEQTSPMAKALCNLLLALPQSRAKSARALPIFEVRYPYGANVTGARSQTDQDKFSKILPPCSSSSVCGSCQELLAELPKHRPLIVILNGSCEEYIQYQQWVPAESRRAPLRFYSQGETIGINRLLNQLYLPTKPVRPIFGRSARCISSGSLTVFFSASLSNPRLIEHLRRKINQPLLKSLFGRSFEGKTDKELGSSLDKDHALFFRTMADAAMQGKQSQVWQSRLLLLPVEPLVNLLKDWENRQEAQAFLLTALSEQFFAVRNMRSDFLRQMVIFNRLAAKKLSPYAKSTVHYLIELIRGEFPGLVPHDPELGDDFGPAAAVYKYMEKIGVPKFLKDFPGLLRPAHLGVGASNYIYYSLERPTLLAPVGSERSVRSVARKVSEGLKRVEDEIPDLFDSMSCEFFVSGGKSQGPRVPGRPSDLPKETIQFKTYQQDERIRQDFARQLDLNKNNGWSALTERGFHRGRGGFMASFVRIRTAAKIKEEDRDAKSQAR